MRETVEVYKGLATRWVTIHKLTAIYSQVKQVVVAPWLAKKRDEMRAQAQANPATSPSERPKPTTAGGTHAARGVGLREEKFAVIEHWDAAIAYYHDNERLRALVQALANASVKQGTMPPGCKLGTKDVAS
jgi:hypothetical protein